jgi:hypothetical protein
VDDQGFDFRQPAHTREPKRFEPPPWEREAFADLERKREQEAAAAQAPTEPEGAPAEPSPPVPDDTEAAQSAGPGAHAGGQPADGGNGDAPAGVGDAGAEPLDERVVIEMMAGLAAEEPSAKTSFFAVGVGSAIVLVAIGGVLMVWGMAALVGARATGWVGQMGGVGLGMFGVFFFGMGVWLLYRTLKQRGVL